MIRPILILFCLWQTAFLYAQMTTVFEQNFNGSTILSDYNSASPNSNQFHFIGVNPNATPPVTTTATFSNQKITFDRPSTGAGCGFTRTQINNTTTASNNLILTFKISTNSLSVPSNTPMIFYIGENYSTNFSIPANDATFARLGIAFTETANSFKLNLGTSSTETTASFSGEQTIMWVLNNSGETMTYTSPTGASVDLVNDKIDIWVGNTRIFNAASPQTPSVSLSDFKATYGNGTGSITIDDILVQTKLPPLPIQLIAFFAQQIKNNVILTWQTASEIHNDHFDVEFSIDGIHFSKIGEVKGQKNAHTENRYQFTQTTPSVQKGFYRLKDVDTNGRYTFSKIIALVFDSEKLSVYPNPTKDILFLQMDSKNSNQPYSIFDAWGRIVQSGFDNNAPISVQSLPNGFYYLKKDNQIAQFIKQ